MTITNRRGFTLDLSRGVFTGERLDNGMLKMFGITIGFYSLAIGAIVTMALASSVDLAPWLPLLPLVLFGLRRKRP